MILVDSSIWIDHLRHPNGRLQGLLAAGQVSTHAFVIGELACGSIGPRAQFLGELQKLPQPPRASEEEALELIERRRLMARGIGYLDVHLLASALLEGDTRLWTRDRRLDAVAAELDVRFIP